MGINIGYESKNVGDYTEITYKATKTAGVTDKASYQNLYIGKSADGNHFDVYSMTIRPGENKPVQGSLLESIPVENVGAKGIKVVNGSVTLGNISFNQLEKVDDKFVTKVDDQGQPILDTDKSIEIIGTDEADHVVIDGDIGKTKVTASLGKGDDTVIVESNASGTAAIDFGEGNDSLWTLSGSKLKITRPAMATIDTAPENLESGDEFQYIK